MKTLKKILDFLFFIAFCIVALVSFVEANFIFKVDRNTITDWHTFTSWRPWYYTITGDDLLNIHILGIMCALSTILFVILAIVIYHKDMKAQRGY